jgi:hypothetical protein
MECSAHGRLAGPMDECFTDQLGFQGGEGFLEEPLAFPRNMNY